METNLEKIVKSFLALGSDSQCGVVGYISSSRDNDAMRRCSLQRGHEGQCLWCPECSADSAKESP